MGLLKRSSRRDGSVDVEGSQAGQGLLGMGDEAVCDKGAVPSLQTNSIPIV